ncbi:MAG: hypothetical protein ACRCX2_00640, partial [Paraclostridium sp.]
MDKCNQVKVPEMNIDNNLNIVEVMNNDNIKFDIDNEIRSKEVDIDSNKVDKLVKISVGKSRKDISYKIYELPFSKFASRLSRTVYSEETYDEYLAMNKDSQDNIKDVGGFVGGVLKDGKRRKDCVLSRQVLTLDVDFGYKGMFDLLTMITDYTLVMYTTHKHSEENERFRLVIPLSKEVDGTQYEAIARMVAKDIGIDYFDDSTYEPSRLMYFPSTSKDGEFRFEYLEDEYLDVDTYLARYEDYKDTSSWPVSSRVSEVKKSDIDKVQNPLQKDGIIGAFCRTYDIHQAIDKYLSDVYEKTIDESRYTYKLGTTSGGLVIYEEGLFAYSHHGSDPCFSKMCNAYDLVKNHKFKDVKEDEAYAKMLEMLLEDNSVMQKLGEEKIETAKSEFILEYEDNSNIDDNEIYENSGWITSLEVDKKGRYKNTINNIVIILENDAILKNKIALNEFSHQIAIKQNL